MNAQVICAACLTSTGAPHSVCPACSSPLWLDNRLRLLSADTASRTPTFVGELRCADDPVAVRVLEIARLSDWRVYERFRRQSEILAALSHPRIPRPLGDFEIRGRVLHCQTLVAGQTLAHHLRGAALTGAQATRLATDLLDVLAHLHARAIVHRDLTPDAVVIDREGRAHVVDFSAAGRRGAAGLPGAAPEVVGTPGFMAPEQARGDSLPQSDLYALGRLLEEALPRSESNPTLDALIAKLTKDDWRKRPMSAAEASRLLEPVRARGLRRLWALFASF